MSYDINSQQVDIENLFKQNVNDLASIKELYRKLKEMEEKIRQIKYIDSKLADKLKKDYEKLKRVILNENIQIQLSNRIDETKTTLINSIDKLNSQLDSEIYNIKLNLNNNVNELITQINDKASKDDVAKISNGSPLFASNTTEMTDITKNYVNTTDGYLYIYSGGSWVKTTVKYQSTGIEEKSITNRELSNDIRISPNSLIYLEKNLININYLINPISFLNWYNSSSTTIIEDNTNKINGFKSLNIQSNSTDTHWNMLKEIPYNKQGKLTFSYLRKASILNGQNLNAVDSNDKWYGGDVEVIENYNNGWDLVKYTINITTNITSIKFYIGNYNGINNYNVAFFTLSEGDYVDILPKCTMDNLSNELKLKINQIGKNNIDVMNYDMLLPSKLFMINEEPLRLYKKNIVVSSNDIRILLLSVSSYDDNEFWYSSKQPYVDYINDKLELNSSNIIGNKLKFTLVGNDLKTRLFKEVEVNKRSKSDVLNKSIIVNMFGDSTTHNGLNYAIKKLLESYFESVTCIGTKVVNGVNAEARGGWLYQQYVGYRTTYSDNEQPITNSDFPNFLKLATNEDKINKGDWCFTRTGSDREKTYNEIIASGGNASQNFYIFDYAHYLETNNFEAPTFVTLGMGINDYWKYPSDATQLCEKALKIIINQIHEASPTTKIILQPFPTKGNNEVQVEWFKKCLELETYFRNIVGVDIEIVAEHISQNKDLFFPTTITEISDKVTNKEIISDEIHTTYAGYSEGARPIVYCMINKVD